jgi:hypothetical protein
MATAAPAVTPPGAAAPSSAPKVTPPPSAVTVKTTTVAKQPVAATPPPPPAAPLNVKSTGSTFRERFSSFLVGLGVGCSAGYFYINQVRAVTHALSVVFVLQAAALFVAHNFVDCKSTVLLTQLRAKTTISEWNTTASSIVDV